MGIAKEIHIGLHLTVTGGLGTRLLGRRLGTTAAPMTALGEPPTPITLFQWALTTTRTTWEPMKLAVESTAATTATATVEPLTAAPTATAPAAATAAAAAKGHWHETLYRQKCRSLWSA